ncbi:MAG: hypothetical protein PHF67_03790, partial [Candidatus Nanoarchaeia archaeon]|nr:hypothetical protein [Candidatus Nanoarchaeia archaeon]
MKKLLNKKIILVTLLMIFLLLLAIIDVYINPSRINKDYPNLYTGKILGLPSWAYVPISLTEHLAGSLVVGLLFFYLMLLITAIIA